MAHFKEATLPGPGGGKIIINVDQIRVMHWTPDTTTIRFDKDHVIEITERPEHLMMSRTLWTI